MTISIELSPEQEEQLNVMAKRSGVPPSKMAQKLVVENLTSALPVRERLRREKVMRELVAETERLNLYE